MKRSDTNYFCYFLQVQKKLHCTAVKRLTSQAQRIWLQHVLWISKDTTIVQKLPFEMQHLIGSYYPPLCQWQHFLLAKTLTCLNKVKCGLLIGSYYPPLCQWQHFLLAKTVTCLNKVKCGLLIGSYYPPLCQWQHFLLAKTVTCLNKVKCGLKVFEKNKSEADAIAERVKTVQLQSHESMKSWVWILVASGELRVGILTISQVNFSADLPVP